MLAFLANLFLYIKIKAEKIIHKTQPQCPHNLILCQVWEGYRLKWMFGTEPGRYGGLQDRHRGHTTYPCHYE
jgi:hypothetical protein